MDLVESAITQDTNDRHPWELARSKVVADLIKNHLPELLNEQVEILDIGCGDSWLIERLAEKFTQAKFTAVDIAFTEELISQYQKKLDPNRFQLDSNLTNALKNQKQIDLVLLLDVIEHIENEIDFLKESIANNPSINEETYFLITVPAFQSLFCAHDTFLEHYRRYSNTSLKKALESAGLEVVKNGYFFSSLLLPRAIIKLLESTGLKSTKVKGIGAHKKGSLDGFIQNTLIFDYRIGKLLRALGINPAGLSNFAIAKPKRKN